MEAATTERGDATRQASRLVWALAFVGLALGAFILVTLELLLEQTRDERGHTFDAAQRTGRALAQIDVEFERARDELLGTLDGIPPAPSAAWMDAMRDDARSIAPLHASTAEPGA